MSSKVNVENFDEMRLGFKKEVAILSKQLNQTLKAVGSPKMNVDVMNLKDLIQVLIKLAELVSSIEFSPKFELPLPNITVPDVIVPEIKIPEIKVPSVYVPAPQVTVNPHVDIDLRGVIEALKNLKYLSNNANSPLAVRMSDGNKFVKAIQQLKDTTEQLGVVYAGQSGMTIDELRTVSGRDATDYILDGTARLTPKFAKISAASSGDNTIVLAVTGKKIRVIQMDMISAGDVNAKFQTGASGTDLTGLSYLTLNTGLVRGYSPVGWFETVAGQLLNLNLSDAIAVGGSLTYLEV